MPGAEQASVLRVLKILIHRDEVIAFILPSSRYLNAIQTMCPHILRYLTTAVITNKDVRKRRQVLKDLVKVIQQVPDGFIFNVHGRGQWAVVACWAPSTPGTFFSLFLGVEGEFLVAM